MSISEINPTVSSQTEGAVLHALGLHPEERPDSIQQFRRELLGHAPIIINGEIINGWRFAFWRNRVLLALVTALLILAFILTFTPGIAGESGLTPLGNPVSEIAPGN